MRIFALGVLAAAAMPAQAQSETEQPQILVTATGTAKTPPDMGSVSFTVRGEGRTSDEAVQKVTDLSRTISTGVAGLLGRDRDFRSSNFTISEVRPKTCTETSYGNARQLSAGECAVLGYVALLPVVLESGRLKDIGTAAGLIGRLGGSDVRLTGFWLKDKGAARQQAMQAALANARAQAEAIAQGAGAKLGPLLRVQDGNFDQMLINDGMPRPAIAPMAPPVPPPPPPPPPIAVELNPSPIETNVRLVVSYAIAG
jgi:uncharacterized protein YggE